MCVKSVAFTLVKMSSGSEQTILKKKKKKVLTQRRKEKSSTTRESRKKICRQLLLQRQWARSNGQSSRESRREQGPVGRLEHHGGTRTTNGIDHGLFSVLLLSFFFLFFIYVFCFFRFHPHLFILIVHSCVFRLTFISKRHHHFI